MASDPSREKKRYGSALASTWLERSSALSRQKKKGTVDLAPRGAVPSISRKEGRGEEGGARLRPGQAPCMSRPRREQKGEKGVPLCVNRRKKPPGREKKGSVSSVDGRVVYPSCERSRKKRMQARGIGRAERKNDRTRAPLRLAQVGGTCLDEKEKVAEKEAEPFSKLTTPQEKEAAGGGLLTVTCEKRERGERKGSAGTNGRGVGNGTESATKQHLRAAPSRLTDQEANCCSGWRSSSTCPTGKGDRTAMAKRPVTATRKGEGQAGLGGKRTGLS